MKFWCKEDSKKINKQKIFWNPAVIQTKKKYRRKKEEKLSEKTQNKTNVTH